MNYKELELSIKEKTMFYGLVLGGGMMISWLFYDNVFVSIIVIVTIPALKRSYKDMLLKKREDILLQQFRDLLYSLSTLVATGRSIGQALTESIDFWQGTYKEEDYIIQELHFMREKMEKGNQTDVEVMEDFARRSGLEDVKDLVSVCKTCKKSGANLPRAIAGSADIIGDKIAIKKEMETLLAQKKLEGRIVAASPFVMTLFIRLIAPEYLMPLLTTWSGHIIVTIALAVIAYSWILIERMNNIEF